jgi:RimJ/RimL family protein N-acetyltransferase
MTHYTMELMKNVLQARRPGEFVSLLCRIGRGKFLRQHRSVFRLGPDRGPRPPLPAIPQYTMASFNSWSQVDPATQRDLRENGRAIWWDTRQFMEAGGWVWTGRLDGRLANIGGCRTGDRMDAYFFPLPPRCVVFSHFVTLPAFRGRGLFQFLLIVMIHRLIDEGIDEFFIDCADWNLASIRGFRRAGFRFIGTGVVRGNGGLLWYPADGEES